MRSANAGSILAASRVGNHRAMNATGAINTLTPA